MPIQETKLNKLKEFLKLLNESLTREEFTGAFQNLIAFIKRVEVQLTQRIDAKTEGKFAELEELKKLYKETIVQIKKENESTFSNIKKWVIQQIENIFTKKVNEIDSKIKDANEKISQIGSKEETSQQIRDKLEMLEDVEKLSIQAIQSLGKILEELKQTRRGGGTGFSKIAMLQYFIDDETPSGTKNGVNTTFTLAHTPMTGTLKIYRGGIRQRLTEDYTLSNKTITFIVAPAANEIILCDYIK